MEKQEHAGELSITPVAIEPVTNETTRPVRSPVMLQGWMNLASLHWSYPAEIVQKLLPPAFTVDTFNGSAWVGLLPFHMRRVRLPNGLSAGKWSTFPETNVRTYIVDRSGRRGVWFCSLDITRLAPVLVARITYGLPYCWSSMRIESPSTDIVTYTSRRRWPRGEASSSISVRIGEPIAEDDEDAALASFLSARWALGSTFARRAVWAEVDHPPWQLHRAELLTCTSTMFERAGLPSPTGDPVVFWSPGVEVRIGRPRWAP